MISKKTFALFEFILIFTSIFAFSYMMSSPIDQAQSISKTKTFFTNLKEELTSPIIPLVQAASVATYCCERTVDGARCVNAPQDECATGANAAPTFCESTSYCKSGTCYDSTEGTCMSNTPKAVCDLSPGATWDSRPMNEIPQCQLGCCILSDQAAFVSLTRCKHLSSLFGVENDYRTDITDELTCIATAQSQDKGACVYESEFERVCEFTTRTECAGADGSFNEGGNVEVTGERVFFKDFLCSADELATSCAKQISTTCHKGDVYWLDSCGNLENVYSSNKVLTWNNGRVATPSQLEISGNDGDDTNNGNCDYLLGTRCAEHSGLGGPQFGNYYCQKNECRDRNGEVRLNGEAWCVVDGRVSGSGQLTNIFGTNSLGNGKDPVGSRYYREVCVDGQVRVEACADYRNEICIQGSVSYDDGDFSTAACRVNKWQDCLLIENEQDCTNSAKRDCTWISDPPLGLILGATPDGIEGGTISNREYGICVASYPPGLNFWEEGNSKDVCAQASVRCVVKYEKRIAGLIKDIFTGDVEYSDEEKKGVAKLLSDKSNIIEGKECLNGTWAIQANRICNALGDCGGYVNYVGEYTDDGYTWIDPVWEQEPRDGIIDTDRQEGSWKPEEKKLREDADLTINQIINAQVIAPITGRATFTAQRIDYTANNVVREFNFKVMEYQHGESKIDVVVQDIGNTGVPFIKSGSGQWVYFLYGRGEFVVAGSPQDPLKAGTQNIQELLNNAVSQAENKPIIPQSSSSGTLGLYMADTIEAVESSGGTVVIQAVSPPGMEESPVDHIPGNQPALSSVQIGDACEKTSSCIVGSVCVEGECAIVAEAPTISVIEAFKAAEEAYLATLALTKTDAPDVTDQEKNDGAQPATSQPTDAEGRDDGQRCFLDNDCKSKNCQFIGPIGGCVKAGVNLDQGMANIVAGDSVPDGSVLEGGGCYDNKNCKGTLVCKDSKCEKPGRITLGSPCKETRECVENFVCKRDKDSTVDPKQKVCSEPGGLGGFGDWKTNRYVQTLIWAGGAYKIAQLAGQTLGLDQALTDSLSYSFGAAAGVVKFLDGADASKWGNFKFIPNNPMLSGLAIGAAVFALSYSNIEEKVVEFNCQPWQAPIGGDNCELCNSGDLPCSEYKCSSLGLNCEIVNKGTTDEKCVNVNPQDTNPPVIIPDSSKLTQGYGYTDVTQSPPSPGFKIIRIGQNGQKAGNGCIPAFTPIEFGIALDKPAQCKISLESTSSYDDMITYFGGSNLYKYNHTELLSLPNAKDIENSNINIQNGKDLTLFMRCQDRNGNSNDAEYAIDLCVDPSPDTTAPIIKTTSIQDGGCIASGESSARVKFYTNEPANCRWSTQDQGYESMNNQMQFCRTQEGLLFSCTAELTGIPRDKTKFYVRCEDTAPTGRNAMSESYEFSLKGSTGLLMLDLQPSGNEIIYGGVEPMPVELRVETAMGCSDGLATCFYSMDYSESNVGYIQFFDTYNKDTIHTQQLYMAQGEHDIHVRCFDDGGNMVEDTVELNLEIDTNAPVITRVYEESGLLKITTLRDSECAYTFDSCNFVFDQGIQMAYPNSTIHVVEWNNDKTFYIKCRDEFKNIEDDCSMIVRPTRNFL